MEFPIQVSPDTSNLTAFVYVDQNVSKENAGRAEVPLNQVFGDGSQLGKSLVILLLGLSYILAGK